MGFIFGPLHTVAAIGALIIGGAQLGLTKGTRGHRRLGWGYVVLMVVLNATALGIYRETGQWNQFHWLALASLGTLTVGLAGFAVDRRRWWPVHAYWMAGSYLGVVFAGLFQLATHVPWRALAVALASALSVGLAAWLFAHKVPSDVRRTTARTTQPAA